MTFGDGDSMREELAEEFDETLDPLARFESSFRRVDSDPFDLFIVEVLLADDPKEGTIEQYRVTFRQWTEYMEKGGRHPACPNDEHVRRFARWLQDEKGNRAIQTIYQKLQKLNRVFRFWQREPSMPHGDEYDPIKLGREKIRWSEFEDSENKPPHPISLETIRTILAGIDDLRKHAYVCSQLKLGLRVGELCNIRLGDVNLQDRELREHYPELGTHSRIDNRPNAIYIPSKHERDGNKSTVERILPLDDEMQQILRRYLLIRPTNTDDWLYLSREHTQSSTKNVNQIWKSAFHPEYSETDEHRQVTSHFGRHWFTIYWKTEQELPRELVQYLRGDIVGGRADALDRSTIDSYLHAYYEDIEERYRHGIYKLVP